MRHRDPLPSAWSLLFVLPLLLVLGLPTRARGPQGDGARGLQTRTVTFKRVLPRPGLTRLTTEETSMRFAISDGNRTLNMKATGEKRKSEKLLVVVGSTPTKLEVTFHKVVKVEVQNGQTRNVPSPLAGKTYVVESSAGQVVVTTRTGQPVTPEEQRLVADEHKSLGKPNFMLDGIPVGPVRIGARIPSMEEAMKKSFTASMGGSPSEQWSITAPVVTLTGQGRVDGAAVALLDFSMAMTMTQTTGFGMTMHMKGTVTLRLADGWPLRMTMKGPMDIQGSKNAGQMNMSQRTQYK